MKTSIILKSIISLTLTTGVLMVGTFSHKNVYRSLASADLEEPTPLGTTLEVAENNDEATVAENINETTVAENNDEATVAENDDAEMVVLDLRAIANAEPESPVNNEDEIVNQNKEEDVIEEVAIIEDAAEDQKDQEDQKVDGLVEDVVEESTEIIASVDPLQPEEAGDITPERSPAQESDPCKDDQKDVEDEMKETVKDAFTEGKLAEVMMSIQQSMDNQNNILAVMLQQSQMNLYNEINIKDSTFMNVPSRAYRSAMDRPYNGESYYDRVKRDMDLRMEMMDFRNQLRLDTMNDRVDDLERQMFFNNLRGSMSLGPYSSFASPWISESLSSPMSFGTALKEDNDRYNSMYRSPSNAIDADNAAAAIAGPKQPLTFQPTNIVGQFEEVE